MPDLIDPTVTGNYPVILGDGILGNSSNEIFTGVRYNHKPSFSPSEAKLKPSRQGKPGYDLTYSDPEGPYAFSGTRNTNNDDYVLYFDPEREAFILDKVDSTFNMNLTRMPGNSDPEALRKRHPHLEKLPPLKVEEKKAPVKEKPKPPPKAAPTKAAPKPPVKSAAVPLARKKIEKKPPPKKMDLALPVPMPQEPKPEPKPKKKPDDDDDEDEDDDDDGDLVMEYPEGPTTTTRQTDFSPAFAQSTLFSAFMDQRESEAEDADAESDEDMDMELMKLPSPVNHHQNPNRASHHEDHMDVEDEENEEDEVGGGGEAEYIEDQGAADLEDDLEKDLEDALENAFEEEFGQGGGPDGDESEISEED